MLQNYSICGVKVELICPDRCQARHVDALWQELLALRRGETPDPAGTLRLTFADPSRSLPETPPGELVLQSGTLEISRTSEGYCFRCPGSQLVIDLSTSQAAGQLGDAFWDLPIQCQREFFLMAFVIMLRSQGLYALHANGLSREEAGLLIVGESGAGKTTLTLGLMTQGWRLLSDDAVMLRQRQGSIQTLALRRGFSCTRETASYFPGLIGPFERLPLLRDDKRLLNSEALFPGSSSASCYPRVLLFPQVSPQPHSQLLPMDESEAIFSLIEQSPGIMTEQPWASQQLEQLKQLVEQTRSYCLRSGADVLEDPESVSRLIWESLKEESWAK